MRARVIATASSDGESAGAKRFRIDVLHRVRVIEVKVPPLRERRADVLPLAREMLAEAAQRHGRAVALSPEAEEVLQRYRWPGNVQELANAIEHCVAVARSSVAESDDLPDAVRAPEMVPVELATASPIVRTLDEIERDYILAVLDRNDGNQTQTARQLGIGTATLYRKLKLYKSR